MSDWENWQQNLVVNGILILVLYASAHLGYLFAGELVAGVWAVLNMALAIMCVIQFMGPGVDQMRAQQHRLGLSDETVEEAIASYWKALHSILFCYKNDREMQLDIVIDIVYLLLIFKISTVVGVLFVAKHLVGWYCLYAAQRGLRLGKYTLDEVREKGA